MSVTPEWSSTTGDIWAKRWQDLDRALAGVSPHLLAAALDQAPAGSFSAMDVGCGAGTTSMALADRRPDASIIACDLSPSLARIAEERTIALPSVRVVLGNAEVIAESDGPFDLYFSRHGVMFFPNPVCAFRSLSRAANPGSSLVFSCFQGWKENAWASDVASETAGREISPPGREPSGFAFSDPDYVREILADSGWIQWDVRTATFDYVAGEGCHAVDQAISLLSEVGPASALLKAMDESDRKPALRRLRGVVERHFDSNSVRFPGSAWIWTAKAAA